MNKTCQRCGEPNKEKGSFYITTKLIQSTTKLLGLKLCKDCSKGLGTVIWEAVLSYLTEGVGKR